MKKILLPLVATVLGLNALAADKTFEVDVYTTCYVDTSYIDVANPFTTKLITSVDDDDNTTYTLTDIYGSGASIKFALGEPDPDYYNYCAFTLLNPYSIPADYEGYPYLGNANGDGYLTLYPSTIRPDIMPETIYFAYLDLSYCCAYVLDDNRISCYINFSGFDADDEYLDYYDMEFTWDPAAEGIPDEPDEPTDALGSIAADANAAVEYFNLQGVKVSNPENGLYIRRQGSQVEKIRL